MTIHIFGDSFGADEVGWPHQLSKLKNEKVRCLGMAGSGPNDALTKLVFQLEEELITPYDTVVVCLSDQKRLNFSFLKRKDAGCGIFHLGEDENTHYQEHVLGLGKEEIDTIVKHSPVIKTIAQTLGPMFLYENVKNITFLHLIANNFKKIRFIVFTCFSLNHYLSYYKNFNIKSTKLLDLLTFDSLDTDNFDYVKIPIGHIVGPAPDSTMHLLNHMTTEQNIKFGQLVYDVIMYNEIDKSWFVKTEPYDDPVENCREMEPLFIYE